MRVAQFNVSHMRFPWEDPRFDTFRAMVEQVHLNAECHDGYVTRFHGESMDAGYIVVGGDPLCMGNLSVWESPEALKDFVFKDPAHRQLMQWRSTWFHKPTAPHLVMWQWCTDNCPSVEHATQVLDLYRQGKPMSGVLGGW